MSARISRGSPTETPKTSAHDKKIETRVDDVMKSVDTILNTRELKLYALLRTSEPEYQKFKPPGHFSARYHQYANEYNKGWDKSEKYQNRLQFRELVMDRLAKEGLGEHYNEYIKKITKKTSDSDMAAWIHKKLKEISRPTMRERSSSQPVLPVSAQNTASSSKANTTNQLGMPDGTPTATHPPVWRTPDSTPQAPYIPSSAQSSQFAGSFPAAPGALQLQPLPPVQTQFLQPQFLQPQFLQPQFLQPQLFQPQPLQTNTHMTADPVPYPGIPATMPQFHDRQFPGPVVTAIGSFSQAGQTPVNSAALSVRATFSMLGTVAEIETLGFDRDGYVVLLQYLVAGRLPNRDHTESQPQFNERFLRTTQSISEKCATLSPAQQRLWTDNVAVYLVGSVYKLDLAEGLESRLRQGIDRNQIAAWLDGSIPR